jgi:hypothetical protein
MSVYCGNGITATCDACEEQFRIVFDDYKLTNKELPPKANISISACQSGGVYGAEVECPHCKHTHELG